MFPCGVSDSRSTAVCGAIAGRREDGGAVPRVRYLAQDRLQAIQPVQKLGDLEPDRS